MVKYWTSAQRLRWTRNLTLAFSTAPPRGQIIEHSWGGRVSASQGWVCWVWRAVQDSLSPHSLVSDLRASGTPWHHLPGQPWRLRLDPPSLAAPHVWLLRLPWGGLRSHGGKWPWISLQEEPGCIKNVMHRIDESPSVIMIAYLYK